MQKIILLLISCLLIGCTKEEKIEKFYLNDNYYSNIEIKEISDTEYNNLIEGKDSFALLIYMPGCTTSAKFSKIVEDFSNKNNISFYKMKWADAKKTKIYDFLKYYPSVIVYNKGEHKAYLKADSDDDLVYYESVNDFKTWMEKYVYLDKE